MIRFQGRSFRITFIKGKLVPIGFKIYTVASEGYLLGFRSHRGEGGYDSPQSVLQKVVLDLVQPRGGCHRTLYFDNLYTSPALCDSLLHMGIRSCGTCRSKMPPGISSVTTRPTVAADYNFNKSHVHQVDQFRSYYVVQDVDDDDMACGGMVATRYVHWKRLQALVC
jgi:hypothetical protein